MRSLAARASQKVVLWGPLPIGAARADASGRFRIEAPRTSSSGHDRFGAVALAPGYGLGWAELDPDADRPAADITLRPEQEIRGRLFDLQGRPVAGVRISVFLIDRTALRVPGGARPRFDGADFRPTNTIDDPAWPAAVTTDAEGRFVLRGVGQSLRVGLVARHPRFALQTIPIGTDDAPGPKAMTAALSPSQIIHLRLTYADTGRPVPHAPFIVTASHGRAFRTDEAETDADGRARLNSWPADRLYTIIAYPPEGQPYLVGIKSLEWPKGSVEQSVNLALPRGVLIRGRVTVAGDGRPVAGAIVTFAKRGERRNSIGRLIEVTSAADGSFRLGGPPGPGILFVKGPNDDYVLGEIGSRMILEGQPGGARPRPRPRRPRPEAGRRPRGDPHHPPPRRDGDGPSRRSGRSTHRGGLDHRPGRPRPEARSVGTMVRRRPRDRPRRPLRAARDRPRRRDSRLLPRPRTQAGRDGEPLGQVDRDADARRPGRAGGGDRLLRRVDGARPDHGPTRALRLRAARFVDPDGHPVAAHLPRDLRLRMVITPGPHYSRALAPSGVLVADEAAPDQIDPVHYTRELVADAEGRLALPALIPGASYRIIDDTVGREVAPQVRAEFTVRPGETIDLGDIRIEKPRG